MTDIFDALLEHALREELASPAEQDDVAEAVLQALAAGRTVVLSGAEPA